LLGLVSVNAVEQLLLEYIVVLPTRLYRVVVPPLPPFWVLFNVMAIQLAAQVPAMVVPLAVYPVLQLYRA